MSAQAKPTAKSIAALNGKSDCTAMISTTTDRNATPNETYLAMCAISSCKGLRVTGADWLSCAILPSSVCMPIATTTP